MLRLYIRDEETGLTHECPLTENHEGGSPVVSVDWSLEEAVPALAEKIARHKDIPIMQVLLNRPPLKIVAKWTVENGS